VFRYTEPPEGEVRFSSVPAQGYDREVLRCPVCGHFVSRASLDLAALYGADYANSTYGGDLRPTYDRIMGLPVERSDNRGRVASLRAFWRALHDGHASPDSPRLLDVGSGLAVFPALMKEAGWQCTALDPDPRFVAHARTVAGVEGVCADFMRADDLGVFDLITLNKVLEHVEDPSPMLARCLRFLAPGGLVYLELPDGETAAGGGPGREEFFIEHYHIFSAASLALLAMSSGFALLRLERLREPSGKYTLRAFLRPAPEAKP
jgi:SAM-dependent methyltransferase